MRRSIRPLFVVLSLLLGASAFAANERRHKPAEYQDVTDEDRAAARERARKRIGEWHETDLPPEYQFPWMPVGFVALLLVIAVPFGWAAYNRSSKELRDVAAGLAPPTPKKRSKPAPVAEEE